MDFSILTEIVNSMNNFIKTEVMGVNNTMLGYLSREDIYRIRIIINIIISVYAIYLSVKCKGGFHLLDILLSICCGPCYIVYRLVYKC